MKKIEPLPFHSLYEINENMYENVIIVAKRANHIISKDSLDLQQLEEGFESTTITCIHNQQRWDINQINDRLLARGFRMDRGYGKLRGEAFRIAHMGNIMLDDIKEFLQHFDEVIND